MLNYKQMYNMMCEAAARAEDLANEAAGLLNYMQRVCEFNSPDKQEEPIVLHTFSDEKPDDE